MEPVYLVEITAPFDVIQGIYSCVSQKRGYIFHEEQREGSTLTEIKAYMPVSESFGFTGDLRSCTSGKAFPQCSFDHWEQLNADPLDDGSKSNQIMMDIRKRKDLKLEIPSSNDYLDRL